MAIPIAMLPMAPPRRSPSEFRSLRLQRLCRTILPRMESSATSAARGLVVALDGPGSSGKSSVGAAAATRLGYRFCDTGLLYRALTWLALHRSLPLDDGAALAAAAGHVELAADEQGRLDRVMVDGRDVTAEVHSAAVDEHVSVVARLPE